MTIISFVRKNMFRDGLRTNVSFVAIMLTFFLYVVIRALSGIVDAPSTAGTDARLMVTNRTSFFAGLPEAHLAELRRVEGVAAATPVSFFVGRIPRASGQIIGLAVDPETYGAVYHDANIGEDLLTRWRGEKRAILVGARLARTKGWRTGDVVTLESLNIVRSDGAKDWPFVVAGEFQAEPGSIAEHAFLARIDYVTDARMAQGRRFDMLGVRGDGRTAPDLLGQRIETALRFHSPPVRAADEEAFVRGQIEELGNLRQITFYILAYALAVLSLVLVNGVALSIRGRVKEYATLKTLGYTSRHLIGMVLAETVFLLAGAAAAGAGCALLVLHLARDTISGMFPFSLNAPLLFVEALAVSTAVGLAVGLLPALWASRVSVVETLRSA